MPTFSNVKSVIFDIADHWGSIYYMGVRQIDFYNEGSKISLTAGTDFTAYATTTLSNDFLPKFAFDTSTSYTGNHTQKCWMAGSFELTDQRLIIVFDTVKTFDSIVVNNYHGSGTGGGVNTDRGIKNIVIHTSTDTITDTTYEASITNSAEIFDGQIAEHVASDVQDDQTLSLVGPGPIDVLTGVPVIDDLVPAIYDGPNMTAKSIIIDVVNNWGNPTYTGLRSVEFYKDEVLVPLSQTDYTAQATTTYTSVDTDAEYIFDTSLSKTGNFYPGVAWLGATTGNFRISVVFDTPIDFDLITINNHHENGAGTIRGIKDTKIYSSIDSVTSTTYDADTENYDLIFDGRIPEHVESDTADDSIIYIIVPDPTPFDVLTGVPVIGTVTAFRVIPDSVLTGSPVIDSAIATFIPTAEPVDVISGAPVIDLIVVTTTPVPEYIWAGNPVISAVTAEFFPESKPEDVLSGVPVISDVRIFYPQTPKDVLTGNPVIGAPLAFGICYPEDVVSGNPVIGTPLAYVTAVIPDLTTGTPVIGPVNAEVYTIDFTQATQHYVCHIGNKVVPISSFQCRLQANAKSYLQVVVPGTEYAEIIADSADEELIVQSVLKVNGIARSRGTIASADISDIRFDDGPLNKSITVAGYKDPEPGTTQYLNIVNSTYRRSLNGKLTHRFAEPNTRVRPGDEITVGNDTYVVGQITYYARIAGKALQTSMEITEA